MKTLTLTLTTMLIVTFGTISTTSWAQMSPYKFNQLFHQAFAQYVDGNHHEALPIFERLYFEDGSHGQVAYLYAMCRVKTNASDLALTRNILQCAARKFDYQHRIGHAEDRTAPVKVWFYLAEVCAKESKVEKAIESYRNYMSCIQLASLDHKRMVKQRIDELRRQRPGYTQQDDSFTLANTRP